MKFTSQLFILLLIFLSFSVCAGEYTVEQLRGEVTILRPGHQDAQELRIQDPVPEDSSILTQKGAYVKIKDKKGNSVFLGPNSKMVIESAPKVDKPSVLYLLKGVIRSKVIHESNQIKQVVRTRNVALGVRGTEFMVSFNPEQESSSVVMFDGTVAIEEKDLSHKNELSDNLEKVVERLENSQLTVTKGEFFGVKDTVQTEATPIAETQLSQLEARTNFENPKEEKIVIQNDDLIADLENGQIITGREAKQRAEEKAKKKKSEVVEPQPVETNSFNYNLELVSLNVDAKQTFGANSVSSTHKALGVKAGVLLESEKNSFNVNLGIMNAKNDIKNCTNCKTSVKRQGENKILTLIDLSYERELGAESSLKFVLESEERLTLTNTHSPDKSRISAGKAELNKIMVGDRKSNISLGVYGGIGSMSKFSTGSQLGLNAGGKHTSKAGNVLKFQGVIGSENYGDDSKSYESRKVNLSIGIEF